MKTNYHTHHELCGHAIGTCEDYVLEAIKNNYQELGFSDHAPNSRVDDFGVRMKPKEFTTYLEDIKYVQEKYKNSLTIKKGMEVEFFYDHAKYYEFLKGELDYLILGQHYISHTKQMNDLKSSFALTSDKDIEIYAEFVCEGMKTMNFNILAHPDLYMCGYQDWNQKAITVAKKIIKCAEKTNTILEFNGNGFRRGTRNTPQGKTQPYPRIEFWNLVKEHNVKTIFGVDCHSPEQIYDTTIKEAEVVYKNLGTNQVEFLFKK
ncbi:phosphatase YcdX [Candidatus Izimaplasma bacterium HR1]|jgi:histidinol-phosphatase (PHP family)|uniref:histidinol-phosphatase n=1 Tax=Candidatus Izimoplasma sp. HR1 TaxID=1541959 RepID=UPI0004F8A85C|nr:phosphatase YcdX [Candidatus Izimaplasma bacterium HR1]